LWPDGKADVSLLTATNVSNAIGTSSKGTGDVHVNVAFTDLRPEDALYATTRALGKLNTTTWSGLGYIGPTSNIGAPIYTAQGTGTSATPVKFALSGKADPITKIVVPAYTTIPVGAEPVIFVLNNGGAPFRWHHDRRHSQRSVRRTRRRRWYSAHPVLARTALRNHERDRIRRVPFLWQHR
jgi:hypothetical protein